MMKSVFTLYLLIVSMLPAYSFDCDKHIQRFKSFIKAQPELLEGERWTSQDNANSLEILKKLCINRQNSVQKNDSMFRDGHAKAHACFNGKLSIDNSGLDEKFRLGLFAENKTYDIYGRYSNASGEIQDDKEPDIKGLALKLHGVNYKTYLENFGDDEIQTHDLLFINSPNFFVEDTQEYLDFIKAHQNGSGSLLLHGVTHPVQFYNLLKALFSESHNLLSTKFFSSVPYRLGKGFVRTNLTPCQSNVYANNETVSIRDNLNNQMSRHQYCYDYSIQFLNSKQMRLLEQPASTWDESESPFIKIGQLFIPKQKTANDSKCEDSNFNPWRSHELNRPAGQINRIRLMVYRAQFLLRKEYNESKKNVIYLEQNWTPKDRDNFYYKDQGSRIIDIDIFKSLETKKSKESLFYEQENLKQYGFLYEDKLGPQNPNGFPIGMSQSQNQMGVSCALCHTRRIEFNNKSIFVDGSQAEVDFVSFLKDLKDVLYNSLNDKGVYNRTFKRYLQLKKIAKEKEFKSVLEDSYKFLSNHFESNPSSLTEGYGRLDAITWITNLLKKCKKEHNFLKSKSSVSYPYLWNTHQLDWLQWNGAVANSLVSPLARNVGQAIASFARVEVVENSKFVKSTIDVKSISELQNYLAKLKSPKWPNAILPEVDKYKAIKGRVIYAKKCMACHFLQDRDSLNNKIITTFVDTPKIQTDDNYTRVALNASSREIEGNFSFIQNTLANYIEEQEIEVGFSYYKDLITGVFFTQPVAALKEFWQQMKNPIFFSFTNKRHVPKGTKELFKGYRARPLNGIWATAPYLHNGSVPTLYDLLNETEKRPSSFKITPGSFDPVKVGLGIDSDKDGKSFTFNTSVDGNQNSGHYYGTSLKEHEKWELIEYLKTL